MDAKIPDEVANAARMNFGIGVTAYLHNAEICGFSLTGQIYFDYKDRFKNSRLIRTSDVLEFVDFAGYLVAMTCTGSAYVLVEPGCGLLTFPSE